MLYETFNLLKESFGEDYFKSRVDPEIVQNLNPQFENKHFKLIGLPFYNEKLKKDFEQALNKQILT